MKKKENIFINEDQDCDVAIIWSLLWAGRMLPNKKIWEEFRAKKKPVVVLEVGGLKRDVSWKIGINGINREADFANETFDNKRWPLFQLDLKPWKQTGENIILCGQHDKSYQWRDNPTIEKYIENTVTELRKYTSKKIIIRPHPRNHFQIYKKTFTNVEIKNPEKDLNTYDDTDFKKYLQSAWAVVNYSSNPAIQSVINGIPVFVSPASLCYDVGNNDLANIENPKMPDRQNWANKLSYTEWTTQEIREGTPWARIRERLLEKYI